ncbi:protein of unknown function [Taphrina deformans PYCC 5710]|uniref:Uncharacterized protein n=1 Tax=Taphrina deformans (strain PYCC 5710 / ATCC 11124 / CBS 356.35 / IMI 108563 / JCM 9778 / NBRC 8474) TaxID=1097556 RepID=R4XGG6_TAPDE|nr:protein of unknown function [Taphrina deformans PYCC 5710]|eukprot:CCG84737.1 protein of unknown function [Taphrina deformans PYCC 5710]
MYFARQLNKSLSSVALTNIYHFREMIDILLSSVLEGGLMRWIPAVLDPDYKMKSLEMDRYTASIARSIKRIRVNQKTSEIASPSDMIRDRERASNLRSIADQVMKQKKRTVIKLPIGQREAETARKDLVEPRAKAHETVGRCQDIEWLV